MILRNILESYKIMSIRDIKVWFLEILIARGRLFDIFVVVIYLSKQILKNILDMELFGMWLIIIKSLRTTVYKRKKEKVETLKLLSKVLRFRSSFCLRWLVSLRSPRVFSNEFVIISPSMGKKKRTRRTEPEPNQNIWNRNRIEILKYPSCSYISILEIIEPELEPNIPEYPKNKF